MPSLFHKSDEEKQRKEKLSHLKKEMEQAEEAYSSLDHHLDQDSLSFEFSKNERKKEFFALYQQEIEQVLSLTPEDRKEVGNFSELLTEYYRVFVHTPSLARSPEDAEISSKMQSQALAKEKREKDGLNENLSKNISSDQQNGLREISKWMYRNANHKGIERWQSSQQRFVHHILALPPRMRLLMFYLIEKEKRHNPEYGDVVVSQTTYVPNLENFKDKIVASKWKFFLRVTGDQIYWNKLEDTWQIARQASPILAIFGEVSSGPGPISAGGGTQGAAAAAAGERSTAGNAAVQQAQARQQALQTFLRCAAELQTIEASNAKQTEKNLAKLRVQNAYQDLAQADASMPEELNSPYERASTGERVKAGVEAGMDAANTALEYGGKVGDLADYSDDFKWGIPELHTGRMGNAATVFGSASSAIQLVGTVLNCVTLAKSMGNLSTSERIETVSEMIMSAVDSLSSMIDSGFSIAEWAGAASETLTSAAGAGLSIVTGGLHMLKGGFKEAKGIYQLHKGDKVRKELEGANISKEDKAQLKEIMGIQERVAESHMVGGAVEVVQGGLQVIGGVLAASGVGAIAGAVLAGIGTVVGLANSVREYIDRKHNREKTIDGYLKVEPMANLVYDRVQKKFPGKTFSVDHIRKQVRNEMIATLGFASEDSFYNHVTEKYSTFLYNHAFFKDMTDTTPGAGKVPILQHEKSLQNNIYAKAIASFGLKLYYPKTAGNKKDKPGPDIKTIAEKMVI